ncbi:MAG TPA: AzlC family ABC transporter permease [Vitreimonas sp.]|nr:AzlC family ABC transporter permease [Vitreimonas sp.]
MGDARDVAAARRRLVVDGLGIIATAAGFGFVYGLSARTAGFSPLEASAMSVLVFAGAAQFAAVGYVAGGFSWLGIVLLTAFLNARHLLYSAALAPWYADRSRAERGFMAHFLTDEAFALAITHFRRLGRRDGWGYWFAAIVTTFIPWNVATLAGVLAGGAVPDPSRFGLDVVFPAAMAGLAVALATGRREAVAAIVGALLAVGISLAWDPAVGIIAGGLGGPFIALAMPGPPMRDRYPADPMPLGVGPEDAERLIDPGPRP